MRKSPSIVALLAAVALPGFAIFTFMLAAWITVDAPPARAAGVPIVVIVNSSNPVDDLSMAELKKLFLSDRSHWDTGKSVAPVMLASGAPERTSFLKIVCGMSDADLGKFFMQAAFTGKSATPPKEVASAGALKSFVAGSPGAIGFVKADDFHEGEAGIKAVKIDGATASDSSYKLKT